MVRTTRGGPIWAAAVLSCVMAAPAWAQGHGNGNAFGHGNSGHGGGTTTTGPSAAGSSVDEIQIPGNGVRTFGSWLDDATVMKTGSGYLNAGIGWWKTPSYHEFDAPMFDTGVAVSPRVQFGVSVPYYRANEPGGPVVQGFGNAYLSTKIQLRDPSSHAVGFALTPAVEILNSTPAPGESRVNWVLPASVEVQGHGYRVYGSTGYFSRGSLFAAGAIEVPVSQSAWLTGTISHSYSNHPDPVSVTLGLSQTRTDVTGGATVTVRPNLGVFGSIGRTISRKDANSASMMLTLGVSINY
jgi:hypothetical protein